MNGSKFVIVRELTIIITGSSNRECMYHQSDDLSNLLLILQRTVACLQEVLTNSHLASPMIVGIHCLHRSSIIGCSLQMA